MLRVILKIAATAPAGAGKRLGSWVVTSPASRTAGASRTTSSTSRSAVGGVLIGKNLPLGDGVNANDVPFATSFPYVREAPSGFDDPKGE